MNTPLKLPTNDPNLPSFLEAEYLETQPDLQLVWDCWNDLKDRQKSYLPQEDSEPARAYNNRVGRTRFDNRYEPAIKGHAGLLSDFTLNQDVAPSLEAAKENIDQQGNDIITFFTQLDEIVLRDGGAAILVEHPPKPVDEEGNSLIQSAADQQEYGLRPYLVAIDRRNILNWDVVVINGKPRINRVTIRETHKVSEGAFGSKQTVRYRVLRPGRYDVYEIVQGQGKWSVQRIAELSGTTDLEVVPLVWYSVTATDKVFEAKVPFLNLAGLNIEHFQKRSSLNEVLHKCNMPVPVRQGYVTKQASDKPMPKLVIGPNSVVDVPVDGKFYFAEPTGNAIAATQGDILKLEGSMDRVSLAFLTGGEAAKTATEVVMDSSQTQCTLKGMARRKESVVQQIFALWVKYTGEQEGGGIKVNESVLQAPANPQEVQTILDSMGVRISNRLGLMMLLQRKWLPPNTDIEVELNQIDGIDQQRQEGLATAAAIAAEAARHSQKLPVAA